MSKPVTDADECLVLLMVLDERLGSQRSDLRHLKSRYGDRLGSTLRNLAIAGQSASPSIQPQTAKAQGAESIVCK